MNRRLMPYRLKAMGVEGFKSLRDPVIVEFGGLTLLAGANSSGKSSFMQPLLLLKQTFEAPYDPGGLLLDGPNVSFTKVREALWKRAKEFTVTLRTEGNLSGKLTFCPDEAGISLITTECVWGYDENRQLSLRRGMDDAEIAQALQKIERIGVRPVRPQLTQYRAFLVAGPIWDPKSPWAQIVDIVRALIHVPALRGNPQRTYRYTTTTGYFPGLFTDYVAGVIAQWQEERVKELEGLWSDLQLLGLTWKIEARRISATDVELRVGRLPKSRKGGARDIVNIADVGFGISQVLPVVVALRAAHPRQMVYIEQPEIHLHPNAQVRLADLLVQAVQRGVQVVVETHSELILLGIQKAIAEGSLKPEAVKLHWFERNEEGVTRIHTAELDEEGTFGDWPVDFSDVAMNAMDAYLDAVAQRRSQQR